jgi:CO dehydrogenase/acetyl-CoA synthase delta subunit
MEKLSLVKKDEVKEVEVKNEVNLSQQVKEEEKLSQELTELACQEEVKEELSSEEVFSEELQEEVPIIEEASQEIEMDETKYVGRDEFDSKISELKGMIEEMKLGYGEEKLSMQNKIEKLSSEPASEPISHNPEGEVKQNFKSYGQNKIMSTRDRVMNRIANLK